MDPPGCLDEDALTAAVPATPAKAYREPPVGCPEEPSRGIDVSPVVDERQDLEQRLLADCFDRHGPIGNPATADGLERSVGRDASPTDGDGSAFADLPELATPKQTDTENREGPAVDGNDDEATHEDDEEDPAERARREEEESLALARALMVEEAMAVSYHMSMDYLRNNRDQFSEEDLAALQAAMDDDEHEQEMQQQLQQEHLEAVGQTDADLSMSYEMMLRLGDRLGDVKSERWAMVANERINALPKLKFNPADVVDEDENDCRKKCLVCQFLYDDGDELRELPCGHRFHVECVDQWLQTKQFCPYCRRSIVDEDDDESNDSGDSEE